MIEQILNNYFMKKFKKYICNYLLNWCLDTRFIEKGNIIELQIKRPHFKDELYKSIFSFYKNEGVYYLLNMEDIEKKLKECINHYLESEVN